MTFNADQIIGKTLFANSPVNIYTLPDVSSVVMATIQPGQPVGVVYSYIQRGTNFWWQLSPGGYVLHQTGLFDIQSLNDQGAIDTATLNAPDTATRARAALNALLSGLKWAIPAALVIFAAYWIVKTYKTAKS